MAEAVPTEGGMVCWGQSQSLIGQVQLPTMLFSGHPKQHLLIKQGHLVGNKVMEVDFV